MTVFTLEYAFINYRKKVPTSLFGYFWGDIGLIVRMPFLKVHRYCPIKWALMFDESAKSF
jgi:hypothetical protein